MLSRDSVPIYRQCASLTSIGSRYGLGSEVTEPLLIVDVDKSKAACSRSPQPWRQPFN
jgi:hypothetical protein